MSSAEHSVTEPTATEPGSTEPTPPIAAEFVRALVAGVTWALVATLSAGLPLGALLPLSVGASCTVLLCLIAFGAFDEKTRGPVLAGTGVLALSALFIGQVLQRFTHHRPLGAVAWVMLLGVLLVPVWAVVRRVNPSPLLGALVFGGSVLVCAALGRDAVGANGWIQLAAGTACLVAALLHRARWPKVGSALAWPIAGTLILGAAWVLWNPVDPLLAERAALVLGWLGLF